MGRFVPAAEVVAPSVFITDPLDMPKGAGPGSLFYHNGQSAQQANFWDNTSTHIQHQGDKLVGANVGTAQTIIDVTGRGKLFSVFGMEAAGAGTCTYTITVDGVETELPPITLSAQHRAIIGDMWTLGSGFTTAASAGGAVSSRYRHTDAHWPFEAASSIVYLKAMRDVRWVLSFKIDLKVAFVQTSRATGSYQKNALARWVLDDV